MTRGKGRADAARYAAYARCSSDDQKHKDFSTVDVQQGLNAQLVRERGGILVGGYKDEGISGSTLERRDWKRLLADARAGLFDVVVVTYMSRLGRGDIFTVAEYLLKEVGVKVEMVKEQFADDMSGHVNKKMTQFVDGMYPKQVSQWTRTKMEQMVAAGFFPGGYPPFGLVKVVAEEAKGFHRPGSDPPKRLVPDPENADVVRQAFALLLDARSLAAVRIYLNRVTTRKWTTTSVKGLLTNENLKGDLTFGQWRKEGAWEPVVGPDVWQEAQAIIAERGPRPPRPDAGDFTYYLRGRVRCPHCRCPYTQSSHWGRGGQRVHYYVCQTANRQKRETAERCPVGRVNAVRLHATVLRFLARGARHHTFMHKLIAGSGGWGEADDAQKAERGLLGKKKQALEMQIANYVRKVGDGRDSPAVSAALDRAEAERDEVCGLIEEADRVIAAGTVKRPTAARVMQAWGRVGDIWGELTEEERADLLGSFVQAVEVTDKESVALELLPVSGATLSEVRAMPSFGSRGRT